MIVNTNMQNGSSGVKESSGPCFLTDFGGLGSILEHGAMPTEAGRPMTIGLAGSGWEADNPPHATSNLAAGGADRGAVVAGDCGQRREVPAERVWADLPGLGGFPDRVVVELRPGIGQPPAPAQRRRPQP